MIISGYRNTFYAAKIQAIMNVLLVLLHSCTHFHIALGLFSYSDSIALIHYWICDRILENQLSLCI